MQKEKVGSGSSAQNHVSWDGDSTLALEGSDTFLLGCFEENTALTWIWTSKRLSRKRPKEMLRVKSTDSV